MAGKGKGWHGEPGRHAKAARGVKTKGLTSREGALRKATQEYLAEIAGTTALEGARAKKGERVRITTNSGNTYFATVVSAPDEFGRQWVVRLDSSRGYGTGQVVPFHESDGRILRLNGKTLAHK